MKRIALALALITVAACSRDMAGTAVTVAATTSLPKDVQDLAVPQVTTKTLETPIAETKPAALSATGELISPMRSQVAPKIPGRIAAVYVNEGAYVTAGQALASLETQYLSIELQRAQADLARAKAMEADAQRELARKQELIATESVSRAMYDRAQTSYETSVAAHQAASAALQLTRQRLADSTIRAPFSGAIESRSVDVGEHIGEGASTFVLVQTSPLKIRFRLPEQYLGRVHEGQKVSASVDAFTGKAFAGHITMIGSVIDPATRTLVAEADIDNSNHALRPGMFARVTIEQ